ncbi:bidirectional sugar transporter [Acrasis kona]|uniref:Bidirectional sugar transporter n=1 Tax=Acrasis kona TaxID=1008807 RepID=A0AAW2YXQ2_9EUKA
MTNNKTAAVFEAIKFNLSGLVGTALFYFTYEMLYAQLKGVQYAPTIAWVVSYLMSIWWQFELYRWFVFDIKGSYWKALWTTYVIYSGSLVASTIASYVMVDIMMLNHRTAWLVNSIVLGIMNYFLLKSSFGNNKCEIEEENKQQI